jgi:hypothetical protein
MTARRKRVDEIVTRHSIRLESDSSPHNFRVREKELNKKDQSKYDKRGRG